LHIGKLLVGLRVIVITNSVRVTRQLVRQTGSQGGVAGSRRNNSRQDCCVRRRHGWRAWGGGTIRQAERAQHLRPTGRRIQRLECRRRGVERRSSLVVICWI
jgi:hypothetical protein